MNKAKTKKRQKACTTRPKREHVRAIEKNEMESEESEKKRERERRRPRDHLPPSLSFLFFLKTHINCWKVALIKKVDEK